MEKNITKNNKNDLENNKSKDISSLGKTNDSLTVQKSKNLFALWKSDLTLAEFKILDVYLSRINSHEPEKRRVVFGKDELEKILVDSKISNSNLQLRLKHLMGNVVTIPDKDEPEGYKLVTLFEEAEAVKDANDKWIVNLECTSKAMKYFFNIEKLGYLRYKLNSITSITSRFSYILFLYLEDNRYRKTWTINLQDLREMLNCDEESYKEFRYFNRDILKKVQKEIHEKTECRFEYETIKKGKYVIGIKFTIHNLPLLDIGPYASSQDKNLKEDDSDISDEEYENKLFKQKNALWIDETPATWFTIDELKLIANLLYQLDERKLPPPIAAHDDIRTQRASYIAEKISLMRIQNNKKEIKNKCSYLSKIIKSDIKSDMED